MYLNALSILVVLGSAISTLALSRSHQSIVANTYIIQIDHDHALVKRDGIDAVRSLLISITYDVS